MLSQGSNLSIARGATRAFTDRVAPAGVFAYLLLAQGSALWQLSTDPRGLAGWNGWLASWLLVQRTLSLALVALVVVLFLARGERTGPRAGTASGTVAVAGTWILALQVLAPGTDPHVTLAVPATLLLIAGNGLAISSLACLGRSFGILPEARALVTRGPYRWVRHPVYLGEIVAATGAVLPFLSPFSLGLLLTFAALQYWRALNEEQALLLAFPRYESYAAETWRIIPGLH